MSVPKAVKEARKELRKVVEHLQKAQEIVDKDVFRTGKWPCLSYKISLWLDEIGAEV